MKDDRYTDIEKDPGYQNQDISLGVIDVEPEIHYRWRFAAKVVAYVNLVLGGASYAVLIVAAILFIFVSVQMKRGYLDEEIQDMIPGLEPATEDLYIGLGALTLGLATAVTSLEFISANILRKATTKISEPHEILKKCLIWRNVSIFLLLLSIPSVIRGYNRWMVWLWVKFRLFCLMMVWFHIRELKQEAQKLVLQKEKYVLNAEEIVRKKADCG